MHIHRLEKIWLIVGTGMLAVFLLVLGFGTFALGAEPPGSHGGHSAIDPTLAAQTPPFDNPGLVQIGDNEYAAYMLAYAFGYSPQNMEVPVGAKVHFYVTSTDVVHGFAIPKTNVNFMVIPGEVNHVVYTFKEPGEYLVLCNEYCGVSHQYMMTKIIVK